MSDVVIHQKYANYLPEEERREGWEEIVQRNENMHIKRFPHLEDKIREVYKFVYNKEVLPSMRSMQFAGVPIEINNSRMFNCSGRNITDPKIFAEAMFLLLSGAGFGSSVQLHHISQLPTITSPKRPPKSRRRRFLVEDSIEGWADAIKVLLNSYFYDRRETILDLRNIRPKGSPIRTSGGKAPGPAPLRTCISAVTNVLENALSTRGEDTKLTSVECADIMCHVALAVRSGGVRRSAISLLFSPEDREMMAYKAGNWYETMPHRAQVNISCCMIREDTSKEYFQDLWNIIKANNSGEPGIYWTNDKNKNMLANPCFEVSGDGKNGFVCNLTEINGNTLTDQDSLNKRAAAAAFIGTLQSSYTDFHYIRSSWAEQAEREPLLGVSINGIATGTVFDLDMSEAAEIVKEVNKDIAGEIGIKKATRTTLVKPSGTSSLVLGCSSGVGPWFAPYYLRRVGIDHTDPMYNYLIKSKKARTLLEVSEANPSHESYIVFPVKAPEGAVTRESLIPLKALEMIKTLHKEWIMPGHLDGIDSHNVSCTVFLKNHEYDEVGNWMYENRYCYNGIAVFPYDGSTYVQTPYEEIDEEEYNRRIKLVEGINIDVSKVIEHEDNTDLQGEQACAGGACEV